MVERYGLWPGVVAIVGDADGYCVPYAKRRYGADVVQAVIDGLPGYERLTDHEGNPLSVVLYGSEDCAGCAVATASRCYRMRMEKNGKL